VYIIRRKRYYRQSQPTRQVLVIMEIINDYLNALGFKREIYETFREYALRIDGYRISEMAFSQLILAYEGIIYGGYTVDELCRDAYTGFLIDVKKSAKKHIGLIKVIKLNIKELISF